MSMADEALEAADGLAGVTGLAGVRGIGATTTAGADRAALAKASLVDLAGEGSTRDGESGTFELSNPLEREEETQQGSEDQMIAPD